MIRMREDLRCGRRRFTNWVLGGLVFSLFAITCHGLIPVDAFAQLDEFQREIFDYYSTDPAVRYRVKSIEGNHMVQVMGLLREGKQGMMISEIEFILRYVPNHAEALIYAEAIGKMTSSVSYPIRFYENAIRIFPGQPLTYMQYGAYLVKIGNLEMGVTNLKKAIELEPNLSLTHVWLAKAYKQKGDPEAARSEAEKAVSLGYKGELLGDITGKTAK